MQVETHYKILHLTPEKLDEISEAATKAVAVSDQKELEAKEASEAADRAKKVLEENQLVLQAAKEALDRCNVHLLNLIITSSSSSSLTLFCFLSCRYQRRLGIPAPKALPSDLVQCRRIWRTGSFG